MSLFKKSYEHIWLHDNEGNEYLYTLLFTLKSEYSNKSIAVVTRYDIDKTDNTILTQAFYFEPQKQSGSLANIDNDRDWELIDKFLRYYQSPFKWFLVNVFLRRCL